MAKTLFIADDSPIILKSLTEIFSKIPGLSIIGIADSVKNAIESLKNLNPDIIILDYQFKKGTGLEILKYIRSSKTNSIVFVFTNYGYSEYREQCLKEGADFFFKKLGEAGKLIEEIGILV